MATVRRVVSGLARLMKYQTRALASNPSQPGLAGRRGSCNQHLTKETGRQRRNTAVSTKVQKKRKSVSDNAER